MVKRWLSIFVEQPRPAALQVVAEDLDERMRCSHDLGHQRGGVLQICVCGSITVARASRVLRGRSRGDPQLAADVMACLCEELLGDASRHAGNAVKRRSLTLLNETSFLHAVFDAENRSTSTFLHWRS